MTQICFLNNQFLNRDQASVSIEDRGFQLADGVYEVILFKNSTLIDAKLHLNRFFSGLSDLNIEHNFLQDEIIANILELFAHNKMSEGFVYLQMTRGAAKRFQGLSKNIAPTLMMTVDHHKQFSDEDFERGVKIMSAPDIRWHRVNIKTVMLLPSALTKQKAMDLGYNDALYVRDNIVTEGTYANFFFVNGDGNLVTKKADNLILGGITRIRIIDLARKNGIEVFEEDFTLQQVTDHARECFLSSSTLLVRPVVQIDDKIIGAGVTGAVTRKIRDLYRSFISGQ
tara:strand:- start:233 stop:1084 length:852 start_codon:yes stop_codon:yes gene_type:complete